MSGIGWHIFAFGAIAIFLVVIVYRILAISRLPVHLRWELAPIPHEKGKTRYGGSYLEEPEWWRQSPPRSRVAPIIYIAREMLLMRGVWEHNRGLWPFSFALHTGIYLIVAMLVLQALGAIFMITEISLSVLNVFQIIANIVALVGYLLGSLGAIGCILKRALDANLRLFSTIDKYFRLLFLGAAFVSGGYAWLFSPDFTSEMNLFLKGLITLDTTSVNLPIAVHIIISLLFLIYLPFTDMIHFVAKYFTYHEIRWDDAPKDARMIKELRGLLSRPVTWSAAHVKADGKKTWADVATGEASDEKES